MKNQKGPGKGPSQKPRPSSSSTPSFSDHKSRWESSDSSKRPSTSAAGGTADAEDDPNPSDSKPPNKLSSSSSAAIPKAGVAAPGGVGPSAAPLPGPGPLLPPPPGVSPFHLPPDVPPPPPSYGFHNLERRMIVLADGSVRSYFALPPDPPVDPAADRFLPYGPRGLPRPEDFRPPGLGLDKHLPPGSHGRGFSPEDFREPPPFGRGGGLQHDYWASLGLDGPRGLPEGPSLLKRKYGEEGDLAWHRHHIMQYGNPNANTGGFPPGSGDRADYLGRSGSPHRDHLDELRNSKQPKLGGEPSDDLSNRRGRGEIDAPPVVIGVNPEALNSAFLRFSRMIYENPSQKKNYLEDGKSGPLSCIACGRSSMVYSDVHGLIIHAYTFPNKDMRADHLGLHKALCVLMGWSYEKVPDSSKAYQSLSAAAAAAANRDDLILWPPTVIIHNTILGQRKDGRMEGMGNKEMDNRLKELGFCGGKARSLYGKEGHLGITVVKFAGNRVGLKEAERLAEFFDKENHGRKGWARVQASRSGNDDDKNPALMKVDEKTGEKKRILYGYLAIASDLDEVDSEMRKKTVIKSRSDPGK